MVKTETVSEDSCRVTARDLKKISSRYEAILAAVPDIVAEVDINKVYTWMNPAGKSFFGNDVIGKKADYYFEGEQKTFAVVQPVFLGTKDTVYVESWQRRRDGQKRLLAWWCRTIKDQNGKVSGALSSAHDITDIRRAEERFDQIAATAREWIWEVDKNGLYTYSSFVVKDILGYKPEEIVGKKHFYDFFPKAEREKLKTAAMRAFTKKEKIINFINSNVNKKGATVLLQTNGTPILNRNGDFVGYRGVDSDVTEREKFFSELKREKEQFQLLAENISDVIWMTDLKLNFTYISPSAKNLTGYTVKEALAQKLEDMVSRDAAENLKKVLKEALLSHKSEPNLSRTLEFQERRKNGNRIWVEIKAGFIYDDKRQPIGILGVSRDITARKEVEKSIKARSEELVRMNSLMVDRELRMAELKKEIEKLKQQSSQK